MNVESYSCNYEPNLLKKYWRFECLKHVIINTLDSLWVCCWSVLSYRVLLFHLNFFPELCSELENCSHERTHACSNEIFWVCSVCRRAFQQSKYFAFHACIKTRCIVPQVQYSKYMHRVVFDCSFIYCTISFLI